MYEDASAPTAMTGREVRDQSGEKIGVIDDVVYDNLTQEAVWAVVKRGVLHPRPTAVPLTSIYRTSDGAIVVPYNRHTVATAPKMPKDHVLSQNDVRALKAHYGN